MSSFQILTCCWAPTALAARGLACRAYPDTDTGTSEDVFYLLVIRGPTRDEGKRVIEPGSSYPKSNPFPLRHRGGRNKVNNNTQI